MLNFKDWEKVGEDKKTTTLKHKNGHMMTLAHTKLPKLQQEHLKRLKFAEGEAVPAPEAVDMNSDLGKRLAGGVQSAQSGSLQSAQPAALNVPQAAVAKPVLLPDGSMSAPGAAQSSQGGLDLAAQVAAEKGKADANYQQQFLNERQRLNNIDTQHINELKGHTDDFNNYIKANPLNENAYLENKGAGSKMVTALGLILGGFGSGASGGPNMAMDFLNKQIDRNIDAQRQRADKAHTVWGAYQNLYGDQNIANNLAKVSANDMLVHQAEMTAAQLATPQAQANLMQLKGQKAAENNKLILDSAGSLKSTPNMPKGGSGGGQGVAPDQGAQYTSPANSYDPSNAFGNSSANASIPPAGEAKESYYDSHILAPNADAILHSKVQYGGSKAREDYPAARDQLKQAALADQALQKITDIFPKIRSKENYAGALANYINPHAVAAGMGTLGGIAGGLGAAGLVPLSGGLSAMGAPALVGSGATAGAALGEGLGHVAQGAANLIGGNKEIQYQSLKSELKKLIIAALPNASAGEVDDIVDKQAPGLRDDDESYNTKLKAIRDFIISKTPRDLLVHYGAAKK